MDATFNIFNKPRNQIAAAPRNVIGVIVAIKTQGKGDSALSRGE